MANLEALIGISASSLGILLPAFKVVQQMVNSYERIKFARKRCKAVIQRAAFVIKEVHQSLSKSQIPTPSNVTELERKFEDIQGIIKGLSEMSFFKALLRFDEINLEIEEANRHLTDCLHLFHIKLFLHAQAEKDKEAKAAEHDHACLLDLLRNIAGNYPKICHEFELHSDEDEDQAMAAMERKLRNMNTTCQEAVEMQVIQKSFECIKTTTGRSAPKQNKWLITKYDLDIRGTIGGGAFSTVSKAQFRGMIVAVKTLKDVEDVKESLESEIEIWSRLRHDHIVPFYGASTLTHPPYIVSRYMRNGNLIQYLTRKPNTDRTKLMYEVSLGMFYLHEEHIVHGDIKGVNVLVDDSGKACITDFGLSKLFSSGTAGAEMGKISGTLRFLAPEALKGQPLTFETDVYAFGMLIYEVFAGETPFIGEPDDKVWGGCLKLQRPTSSQVDGRGFNDALWNLLSECISREPSARPRFQWIQARLSSMKKAELSPQKLNPVTEDHDTIWVGDTEPIIGTSTSPTLGQSVSVLSRIGNSVSGEESSLSSHRSMTHDIKNVPPVCVEVTLKYFGIKFGISSREPGVYLEENNSLQWQPIRSTKRSLLRAETNRFTFQSSVWEGNNSWDLEGNDVILQSSLVDRGVCRFSDAQTARKWFELQLSFARNGTVGEWGNSNVKGDWFQTVRSWRRFERGKVQKASLVEGAPTLVPSNSVWTNCDLPKRGEIDKSTRAVNCVVCITNPRTAQPGKFCCKVEGCKIILETYRRKNDTGPITAREEVYPSLEDAEAMFRALTTVLGKVKENGRFGIFSF